MITIHLATTPDELAAIQRFRYSVYVEEMGRYAATADHDRRMLVDPEDERSFNFYAHDGDAVVASNRITWGTHGFSERQIRQYGLAPFLAELPVRVLLVGERTMVAEAYRGTSVGADLANGGTLPIPEEDVCVVFGACEPHLVSYYAQLGTVPYASRNISSEESGYLIPLVSFPRGVDALAGLAEGNGLPACIQAVVDSRCAVTSSAIVGDDAYWRQVAPLLLEFRQRAHSLLEGLEPDQIKRCTARSSVIECAAGDRVLKRGGTARNVFVVLAGRLEARANGRAVNQLRPGDTFGEMAFLLEQPRTLDVFALDSGTRVLSFSERTLRSIIRDDAAIARQLLGNVARLVCARSAAQTARVDGGALE